MGVDMLVLGLVLVVTVVGLTVVALRRRETAHDDTLRAGQGPSPTVLEATLRAGGLTAWMRFGGGSGA